MPDDVPIRLLLIVTGTHLRAEEADRPLAYYLKQEAERALADRPPGTPPVKVFVMSDLHWLHEEVFHALPTISLGGPGVNALAQRWLDDLPLSLAVDDHYFIQMEPNLEEPRASLWGMDNADTQIAVGVFARKFLPAFLDRCLELDPPELIDDDEDDDPDFDPDDD